MKFLKGFILFILVLWLATGPIAANARPGSMLYRLNVTVNEPIWIWVHITGEGRAETVERHLEKRYEELEQAYATNQDWQKEWATKAENMTAKRVFERIASTAANQDYKSADTLATHAEAITRAHTQVLGSLFAQDSVGESPEKIAFMQSRLERLNTLRTSVGKQFLKAYDKVDLVRGIDEKLLLLEAEISVAEGRLQSLGSKATEAQRIMLEETIGYAKRLYTDAQNRLGNDQYVESFRTANLAQGYLLEAEIIIAAIEQFGLPVLPTAVPEL